MQIFFRRKDIFLWQERNLVFGRMWVLINPFDGYGAFFSGVVVVEWGGMWVWWSSFRIVERRKIYLCRNSRFLHKCCWFRCYLMCWFKIWYLFRVQITYLTPITKPMTKGDNWESWFGNPDFVPMGASDQKPTHLPWRTNPPRGLWARSMHGKSTKQ